MYRKGRTKESKSQNIGTNDSKLSKQTIQSDKNNQNKNPRKHVSYEKQLLIDRHLEKAQTPIANMAYKDAIPFVSIFSANEDDSKLLYEELCYKLAKYHPKSNLCTMLLSTAKKISLFCSENTLEAMIDVTKCSDLMILVVNSKYFDLEFFEIISLLKATGLCKIIVAVKFHNDKHRMYSRIKRRVWKEICNGLPVIDICETERIARMVKHMKYRPLSFKCNNSYIVVDKIFVNASNNLQKDACNQDRGGFLASEMQNINTIPTQNISSQNDQGESCKREISKSESEVNDVDVVYEMFGYIRGCPFETKSIHIPGKGDFILENIQKLSDPCTSEKKLLDRKRVVVYEPILISKSDSRVSLTETDEISISESEESSSDIELVAGVGLSTNNFQKIISESNHNVQVCETSSVVNINAKNQIDLSREQNDSVIVNEITSLAIKKPKNLNHIAKEPEDVHKTSEEMLSDNSNLIDKYSIRDHKIYENDTHFSHANQCNVQNADCSSNKQQEFAQNFKDTNDQRYQVQCNFITNNGNEDDKTTSTSTKNSLEDIAKLRTKLKSHFCKEPSTISDFVDKFHSENNNLNPTQQNVMNQVSIKDANLHKNNKIFGSENNVMAHNELFIPGHYVKVTFCGNKMDFNLLTIVTAVKTQNKTILQGKTKKNNYFEGLIRSNTEVLMSLGWYRIYSKAIFSIKDSIRNRFLKYNLNGMFCNISFYGNISPPGTPFTLIKNYKFSRSSYHNVNEFKKNGMKNTLKSTPTENASSSRYDLDQKCVSTGSLGIETAKYSSGSTESDQIISTLRLDSEQNRPLKEISTTKTRSYDDFEYEELNQKSVAVNDIASNTCDIDSDELCISDSNPTSSKNSDSILVESHKNDFISLSNDHFRIAAFGTIQDISGDVNILKKIKIIGHPYKIHENTAFIKDMFTSEREAIKFENSLIKTVSNIRGVIKKALRDGSVRCTFEGRISLSDIVFMRCFVRYDTSSLMKYSLFPTEKPENTHSKDSCDNNYSEESIENSENNENSSSADNFSPNNNDSQYIAQQQEEKTINRIQNKIQKLKTQLTLDKQKIIYDEPSFQIPVNPDQKNLQEWQEKILRARECMNMKNKVELDRINQEKQKMENIQKLERKGRLMKNILVSQIEKKFKKGKKSVRSSRK